MYVFFSYKYILRIRKYFTNWQLKTTASAHVCSADPDSFPACPPPCPSPHCSTYTLVPASLESTHTESSPALRGPSGVVLGILRMQRGPGGQRNCGRKGTTYGVISPHLRHALELCLAPNTLSWPQVSPDGNFQVREPCGSVTSVNIKHLSSSVFPDVTKLV